MSIVNDVTRDVVSDVVSDAIYNVPPSPMLHMPLVNSINIPVGIGTATFTRALAAYYEDPADGLLKTVASGVARFEADGYLVEAARTNAVADSSDPTTWTKARGAYTAASGTAPDGNNTMVAFAADTESNSHWTSLLAPTTSGVRYGLSVYAKANGYDFLQFTGSNGFPAEWVNFDLTDGSIGDNNLSNGVASTTDMGNGIYRCELLLDSDATDATGFCLMMPLPTDNAARLPSVVGNDADGTLFWGGQFEASDLVTSYIETTGSAVTRPADTLAIVDENIPAPGSDYSVSMDVTLKLPRPSGTTTFCMKINGESTRRIYINSTSTAVYQHTDSLTTAALPTEKFNLTVTKNASLMSVYIDRVLDSSQAPGTVTGTKNNIHIGRDGVVAGRYLNGHIKNLKIYAKALTASEVATL